MTSILTALAENVIVSFTELAFFCHVIARAPLKSVILYDNISNNSDGFVWLDLSCFVCKCHMNSIISLICFKQAINSRDCAGCQSWYGTYKTHPALNRKLKYFSCFSLVTFVLKTGPFSVHMVGMAFCCRHLPPVHHQNVKLLFPVTVVPNSQ